MLGHNFFILTVAFYISASDAQSNLNDEIGLYANAQTQSFDPQGFVLPNGYPVDVQLMQQVFGELDYNGDGFIS